MTDNPKNPAPVPYAKDMLGFWPQFLIVLVALYFAGLVFAESALGRWILFVPVLMSFLPFGWHVRQTFLGLGLPEVRLFYLTLGAGLGFLLLVTALVWVWRYAFSIFILPLLTLLVYYFGPLLYLKNYGAATPPTDTLSLFAVLASLCLLAYTLPYVRAWLR
jgi:hypothetical protein